MGQRPNTAVNIMIKYTSKQKFKGSFGLIFFSHWVREYKTQVITCFSLHESVRKIRKYPFSGYIWIPVLYLKKTQKAELKVKSLPPGVRHVAGTFFVTLEAINSLGAEPGFTVLPSVSWLTKTGTTDVVALSTIHTLAGLCTTQSIAPHWALILAPVRKKKARNKQTKYCFISHK